MGLKEYIAACETSYCRAETPDEKLKRLEAEQRRVADDIAAVRKELAEKAKPKNTRGEEVAADMVKEDGGCYNKRLHSYQNGPPSYGCTVYFHPDANLPDARSCIAAAIDAEIAAAKKQQREADVKCLNGQCQGQWLRGDVAARLLEGEPLA